MTQPAATEPTLIVGACASAGGLDAFQRLLKSIPIPSGVAFVLIQHLDPDHPSLLTELLSAKTRMLVKEATNDAPIEADHVYVIPPNKHLTVTGGKLRVTSMSERRGARFPADTFLRSLAQDQGARSVAIILSGTGTDGTAGVKAIKAQGGAVIIQDPRTAEQSGMPDSASSTGLADLVLPIEEMADALVKYASHEYIRNPAQEEGPADAALQDILATLRRRGSIDFRAYKPGTLTRRAQRRMGINNLTSLKEYAELLDRDEAEVDRLRSDVLISVTEFFRDAEAFEVLDREVIKTIAGADREDPIRVWVAGCATGEEAYSIGMLLLERDHQAARSGGIQIYATDVSEAALNVARTAKYDAGSLAHVSPERVKRFFVEETPDVFHVKRELRDLVTFAKQDLTRDPPFSRMDLVTCRNVLIYLQQDAQKRLTSVFHFSLKPDGYLFLGSSEGVDTSQALFKPVSKKWRLFKRLDTDRHVRIDIPAATPHHAPVLPGGWTTFASRAGRPKPLELAQRWLMANYAPTSVVVDEDHQIQYLHGHVERYLKLPQGEPRLILTQIARETLRTRLRAALHHAFRDGKPAKITGVKLDKEHDAAAVDIRVELLSSEEGDKKLAIVTFEPATPVASPTRGVEHAPQEVSGPATESLLRDLEEDLAAAKAELQLTTDAYASANAELTTSNEEMMSMNEEFRSTNEELETSKEELQSLNEELNSLNAQLREKIESLDSALNDLANLLTSTNIPTIFLDRSLRIKKFTPATRSLMNLIPTDAGRPLADIAQRFLDDALIPDAQRSLESLATIEAEVKTSDGHRFLRRVQPYRTQDDRIEGVVVTLVDIEEIKRHEDAARRATAYAEAIVSTIEEPLLTLDGDLRILSANPAFYAMFKATRQETEGHSIYDLGNGQWDIPALRNLLGEILPQRTVVKDYEVTQEFPHVGVRTMSLNARRVMHAQDSSTILLAIEDITQRRRARDQLKSFASQLEERVKERTAALVQRNVTLQQANEALDSFTYVVGHDLKEPVRMMENLLSTIEEDAGALTPQATSRVHRAREANSRLAHLITGLLEFSRASRIDVANLQPIRIEDALSVNDCTARFKPLATERGATIEGPGKDIRVLATLPALSQILGNLVQNAIKHNPREHPHVRILAKDAEDPGMIEIVVEDNGPGFTDVTLASFENMSSTTRGFGLAIAKRTVSVLGGTMWLDTTRDGGGAVHFTLRR